MDSCPRGIVIPREVDSGVVVLSLLKACDVNFIAYTLTIYGKI